MIPLHHVPTYLSSCAKPLASDFLWLQVVPRSPSHRWLGLRASRERLRAAGTSWRPPPEEATPQRRIHGSFEDSSSSLASESKDCGSDRHRACTWTQRGDCVCHCSKSNSATGTRTRVARVRAEYPNQLDYSGAEKIRRWHSILLQAFGLSARSRTLTSPGQTGPPQSWD